MRSGLLPLLPTLGLAALVFLSTSSGGLSFLGAAAFLLAWNVALLCSVLRSKRVLHIQVALRKQHYLQACAQASVFLYWGWYWPPVYAHVPYLIAQLLFGYAFDMLLAWSRRDTYKLGFGVFPVIFSINLFLWFRPEWFYLQFAMVALGFLAKELIADEGPT